MSKKRVRGILDLVSLADGEEWELEPMSEDYVYGMGMGATKDATRWAYKGFCLEVGQSIRKIAAKNNGRPRKEAYQSYDCLRALVIWEHVQKYIPQELRSGITNRALIKIMQDGEAALTLSGAQNSSELFPKTSATLETSLSRGRKELKIDGNWESEVCEKLIKVIRKRQTES